MDQSRASSVETVLLLTPVLHHPVCKSPGCVLSRVLHLWSDISDQAGPEEPAPRTTQILAPEVRSLNRLQWCWHTDCSRTDSGSPQKRCTIGTPLASCALTLHTSHWPAQPPMPLKASTQLAIPCWRSEGSSSIGCSELVLVLVEWGRLRLEALALADVEHDGVGLVASGKWILLHSPSPWSVSSMLHVSTQSLQHKEMGKPLRAMHACTG